MKRILLLGDEARALYHPLPRVEAGLRQALDGLGMLEVRTDYPTMTCGTLRDFDMVISYIDAFPEMGPFEAELAQYVRSGGSVLALHNGMITPEGGPLAQCYGGAFITHPVYQMLHYHVEPQNGWLKLEDFSMPEEPYMVRQLDEENQVFLSFRLEGQAYPAGWIRRAGLGTALYLAPGHDERTANNPVFAKLLRLCAAHLLQLQE